MSETASCTKVITCMCLRMCRKGFHISESEADPCTNVGAYVCVCVRVCICVHGIKEMGDLCTNVSSMHAWNTRVCIA
jgi:hypothetical protein